MVKFQCIHSSGKNVIVNQGVHGWRVRINLREPNQAPMTMTGYVTPTLASAKELAEKEILKFGHVCNGSCGGWVEVFGASLSGYLFDGSPQLKKEYL